MQYYINDVLTIFYKKMIFVHIILDKIFLALYTFIQCNEKKIFFIHLFFLSDYHFECLLHDSWILTFDSSYFACYRSFFILVFGHHGSSTCRIFHQGLEDFTNCYLITQPCCSSSVVVITFFCILYKFYFANMLFIILSLIVF